MIKIDEEHQAKAAQRRETRDRVDHKLAERLKSAGLDAVLVPAPATIADLSLDGSIAEILVNQHDLCPARWMIFEATQARYARQWRRRLELFSQTIGPTRRGKFRMIVISAGLVSVKEIKRTHSELRSMLRKVAIDPHLAALGHKLHFGNVEITIHEIDGQVLFHVHSHLLVESAFVLDRWRDLATGRDLDPRIETDSARLRRLSKARREGRETEGYERRSGWSDVLGRLRELNTIKGYAHDAGPVESFDEFVKYMTKSQSSTYVDDEHHDTDHRRLGLFDLPINELAKYCESVKRTNRFQAYCEFKNFLKEIRCHTYDHDPETGEVLDKPRQIRNRIVPLEDGSLALTPVWSPDLRPKYSDEDLEHRGDPVDLVVGLTLRPNADGEMVGCLRVMNPSPATLGDVRTLIEKRELQHLAAEHAAILAARRAERARQYMKHTEQLSCAGQMAGSPSYAVLRGYTNEKRQT